MTPQLKQSWAQLRPACPVKALMLVLTLIRQLPVAWKRIPVLLFVGLVGISA